LAGGISSHDFDRGAGGVGCGELSAAAAKAQRAAETKEREATSRALNKRADRFEQSLAPLLSALQEAGAAAADLVLDYAQNEGFVVLCRKLVEELPLASGQLVSEQRDRAAATIRGMASPSLPAPFVPQVVASPRPPTESLSIKVFAIKPIEYRLDGQIHVRYATQEALLPAALAREAIERGLALPADDQPGIAQARVGISKRQRARLQPGGGGPELPVKLSAETSIRHSLFEEYDRGPPREAWAARPAEPNPGKPEEV
jgi:hypothetical protein